MSMSVRLYILSHISKITHVHEIFCTCYLWPWLGPPLMTMQC